MFGRHPHSTHHHFTRLLVLGVGAVATAIITASLVVQQQRVSALPTPCTPDTLASNISRADLILTGSVFLVVPDGLTYAYVLITPQRVYKGVLPPQGIRIRALATTEGSGITLDDLHFTSQQPPYLLFLQQQTDGTYRTSKCVGSRLLGGGLTPAEQLVLETTITVQ
jgi:hypothetical protein